MKNIVLTPGFPVRGKIRSSLKRSRPLCISNADWQKEELVEKFTYWCEMQSTILRIGKMITHN